jgi:hypothetical protein
MVASMSSKVVTASPKSRAGAVLQKSASQRLYARLAASTCSGVRL